MRPRRLLFYLILVGLLARCVYLSQVAALPFFDDPVGDSARYLERAREILQGRLVGDRPFFYGGILYPWLLALDLLVFGANLYPICLLQAGAGCALAWVLYRFAVAAAPERARPRGDSPGASVGLIAAAMALFYGPFAFFEADILMISWTLLLMMAGALLVLEGVRRSRPAAMTASLAGAGFCLGLAATERPNLLALLPAMAIWSMVYAPRRRLGAACALMAGGAAVLFGVGALNHAASGRWVLLTTSSGINFHIGNHEGAPGTFQEPWSAGEPEFAASHQDLEEASLLMARRLSGRELDAAEASSYWLGKGIEFLRTHPAQAAGLYLRKLALFWNAEEVPNHLNFTFLRSQAPALWLMPLTFGLIAPVGLYGLAFPGPRSLLSRSSWVMLCLLVVVPTLTVMPFFVADRYRAPIVPPLMIAAACGVIALWRLLTVRLTRRLACLHIVCLVLAGVAMSRPMRQTDLSRDYWMLAQASRKQGDVESAVGYYRQALAASPDDAVLRNSLGVAFGQMGRLDLAEEEYRRSVELGPELALPRKNLGLALMRYGPGRADEARGHLLVAERWLPDDIDVARALAVLMLARGDAAGAEARARRVLGSDPQDRTAREVLGAIEVP